MAGTAELQELFALQKKQLAEQQQLLETLLANQTITTETPPATSSSPVASPVDSPVRTIEPKEKYVRITFKVSRVTEVDDHCSTFTAAIKYTATWEPDDIDLQALRRHFAQAEAGCPSEPGVPTWNDWLKRERSPDPVATGQMPNKWNFNVIPGGQKLPAGVWEPRLWIRNEYDRHANYEEEWFSVLPSNDPNTGRALMAYTRETHSTFYEHFELERFPFDNQELQFELVSMQEVPSAELLPKEARKPRRRFDVKLIKNLNGQFPSYCETNNFPLEQQFILSPRVMVWPEYKIDHKSQDDEPSCWEWLGCVTRRVRPAPPSVARQASAPRRRDVRLTTHPSESPSRLRYPRMHVAIRVERKVLYRASNPYP